jgi:hypothetical protein
MLAPAVEARRRRPALPSTLRDRCAPSLRAAVDQDRPAFPPASTTTGESSAICALTSLDAVTAAADRGQADHPPTPGVPPWRIFAGLTLAAKSVAPLQHRPASLHSKLLDLVPAQT